jgi:hypothetical protein
MVLGLSRFNGRATITFDCKAIVFIDYLFVDRYRSATFENGDFHKLVLRFSSLNGTGSYRIKNFMIHSCKILAHIEMHLIGTTPQVNMQRSSTVCISLLLQLA